MANKKSYRILSDGTLEVTLEYYTEPTVIVNRPKGKHLKTVELATKELATDTEVLFCMINALTGIEDPGELDLEDLKRLEEAITSFPAFSR